MVDLQGRKGVKVTSGDGSVLFDHSTPSTYGRGTSKAWPFAEEAARIMWQTAPDGFVEVKGDDYSTFVRKAPLAGFRELWEWGVANCEFPALEKTE